MLLEVRRRKDIATRDDAVAHVVVRRCRPLVVLVLGRTSTCAVTSGRCRSTSCASATGSSPHRTSASATAGQCLHTFTGVTASSRSCTSACAATRGRCRCTLASATACDSIVPLLHWCWCNGGTGTMPTCAGHRTCPTSTTYAGRLAGCCACPTSATCAGRRTCPTSATCAGRRTRPRSATCEHVPDAEEDGPSRRTGRQGGRAVKEDGPSRRTGRQGGRAL